MEFLSTHPLLAAVLVTLSVEGALCLLFYTFTPACGRHGTALVDWWTRTFTDPLKADAQFVPPLTIVHREIDEPTFVLLLPTPEQVERAKVVGHFERSVAEEHALHRVRPRRRSLKAVN